MWVCLKSQIDPPPYPPEKKTTQKGPVYGKKDKVMASDLY